MGTRGWLVFLHRGRYYRIHCSYDCYPDRLGAWLVEELLKADNLDELLSRWKRLLDLGSPAENSERYVVLESPKEDTSEREEWNAICSTIKDLGPVGYWFQGKDYAEDEKQPHFAGNRQLTCDADEVLFFGDRCFIEYIYLITLDDNEFSACQAYDESLICIYPFRYLREEVKTAKNWVEQFEADAEGRRTASRFEYMYPLPQSITDPLFESIKSSGYEVLETVSMSLSAVVYRARLISKATGKNDFLYLKVFFSFRNAHYRLEGKDYATWVGPCQLQIFC